MNCVLFILEEFIKAKDILKEYFASFGSIKMAENLHLLNILSSKRFELLSNLQGLQNNHLASILVQELSHDMKDNKKYISLLNYLKMENSHIYHELLQHSKSIKTYSKISPMMILLEEYFKYTKLILSGKQFREANVHLIMWFWS